MHSIVVRYRIYNNLTRWFVKP